MRIPTIGFLAFLSLLTVSVSPAASIRGGSFSLDLYQTRDLYETDQKSEIRISPNRFSQIRVASWTFKPPDRGVPNRHSGGGVRGGAPTDSLLNQGIQQYEESQFEAALQTFQQALIIYQRNNDRQREGHTLSYLGITYKNLGNYSKAIEYAQKALEIARKINNRDDEGRSLGNLGNAYLYVGAYSKAIEYYQQSLQIAQQLNRQQDKGMAIGSLGFAYQNLGEYDKAKDYAQQWLKIAQDSKDRQSQGQALGNLGLAYLKQGDYDNALRAIEEQLKITQEIKDYQGEGEAWISLGEAYGALKAYGKAIEHYQQSLRIARRIKDRQTEWESLSKLGLALYRSGQVVGSEQSLLDAIAVLESQRQGLPEGEKISIVETQRDPYITLQQVQVALQKPTAALETSERGRARIFVEQLCRRFATPVTTPQCTNPPAISLTQMQQVAQRQKATLVEYSIIPDDKPALYIWVVPPSGPVTFQQTPLTLLNPALTPAVRTPSNPDDDRGGTKSKIAEVVRGTLDTIGATGRNTSAPTQVDSAAEAKQLQALYQQLIAPIAKQLPQDPDQPVIFIPQGPFFQVPFAALQDNQGRTLLEKHTILTAPSIQVLAAIGQQHTGKQPTLPTQALVVGNPSVSSVVLGPGQLPQPLPALPGSAAEAQSIAELLQTQPLLDNAATKAVVMQRMGQAGVIHLATHGFLDDVKGVGMPGAIALTPTTNPPDTGLLTADEILSEKLQANLVVLSACDTGRGRITGDGVVGLSRALLLAGSPSVVVSLWKVPDQATSALMQAFYQQWLRQPERGKASALRQAMLQVKRDYPAPLSWAAFTLIGLPD